MAGDWDGVRGYEVKGINSYAKMVAAYRDLLLAAHAASVASDGTSEWVLAFFAYGISR
jgi:hypothetical protein